MPSTLLTGNDITYLGSFRAPIGNFPAGSPDYAKFGFDGQPGDPCGATYNPANNSLFLRGSTANNPVPPNQITYVAELLIPAQLDKSGVLANVPVANLFNPSQGFVDVTGGLGQQVCPDKLSGHANLGACYPYNGKLYWTAYGTYNNVDPQISHGRSDDLNGTNAIGPFIMGSGSNYVKSGARGGYITAIPPSRRSQFGGFTHICGLEGQSVVSQQSYGPCMIAFNCADVGVINPIPCKVWIFYPGPQTWNNDVDWLNNTCGAAFVDNGVKKGIIILVETWLPPVWYGEPNFAKWQGQYVGPPYTTNPPNDGQNLIDIPALLPGYTQPSTYPTTPDMNPAHYCVDNGINQDKGNHSSGRKPILLIADPDQVATACANDPTQANFTIVDLVSLNTGLSLFNPWYQGDPNNAQTYLVGLKMAFDEANHILYVVQSQADYTDQNSPGPIIHAYQLNMGAPALQPPMLSLLGCGH